MNFFNDRFMNETSIIKVNLKAQFAILPLNLKTKFSSNKKNRLFFSVLQHLIPIYKIMPCIHNEMYIQNIKIYIFWKDSQFLCVDQSFFFIYIERVNDTKLKSYYTSLLFMVAKVPIIYINFYLKLLSFYYTKICLFRKKINLPG